MSAERYITEELKEIEVKIINANSSILELEMNLFEELVKSLKTFISTLQKTLLYYPQSIAFYHLR